MSATVGFTVLPDLSLPTGRISYQPSLSTTTTLFSDRMDAAAVGVALKGRVHARTATRAAQAIRAGMASANRQRARRRMCRIAFAVLAIAEGQGGDRPGDRDEAEQTAEDSSGQHGRMFVEDGLPPGPAKPQRNTDHRETQKQPEDSQHNAAATSRLRHALKCRADPGLTIPASPELSQPSHGLRSLIVLYPTPPSVEEQHKISQVSVLENRARAP